jgi:hypothetical protein
MNELQYLALLWNYARGRLALANNRSDRGDVAEKVVLVGIFVALALAVGLVITKAVDGNAANIAHQINGAP